VIESARHCIHGSGHAAERAPDESLTFDLLATSVAHELRQPLAVIWGCSELLAHRPLGDLERAALVAEIRRAAERLAASLARIENGARPEILRFGPRGEHRVLDLRARPRSTGCDLLRLMSAGDEQHSLMG
jgi:signal transduction histidine kinase